MHDAEVEREAERAIARWAVGEMDLATALHHACWALGHGRPGACALVRHDPAELLGADPRERSGDGDGDGPTKQIFLRIAALAREGTVDLSAGQAGFAALFPADRPQAEIRWALCAPATGPDGELRGALVVVGVEESTRTTTRASLPTVARLCGAMLASEDNRRAAATVAHKMNNLLAAALANLSFACSVAPADGDLGRALQNTRESASLVATHANRLVRLATKGR